MRKGKISFLGDWGGKVGMWAGSICCSFPFMVIFCHPPKQQHPPPRRFQLSLPPLLSPTQSSASGVLKTICFKAWWGERWGGGGFYFVPVHISKFKLEGLGGESGAWFSAKQIETASPQTPTVWSRVAEKLLVALVSGGGAESLPLSRQAAVNQPPNSSPFPSSQDLVPFFQSVC